MKDAETAQAVCGRALDAGLLINVAGGRVLRIAPPINVSDAEIDEGLGLLKKAMQ